jgi:LemA protein
VTDLPVVVAVTVVAATVVGAAYATSARRRRNAAEEAWRLLDAELRRRHGLIGELVGVARETPARLVRARAAAVAAHGPGAQGHAERELNAALANFLAAADQDPDLEASEEFAYLRQQVVEAGDRIAAGRRYHHHVGGLQEEEYRDADAFAPLTPTLRQQAIPPNQPRRD